MDNKIYHAYNRALLKQTIFHDNADYEQFLMLVDYQIVYKRIKAEIIAFCIMPNHFHFLLKQETKYAMPAFISVLSSEYAKYYNRKYGREGQLWQGTYKAVMIKDEEHFTTVLNYIHNNPLDITERVDEYLYCSYAHYLGKVNYHFIKRGRPHV